MRCGACQCRHRCVSEPERQTRHKEQARKAIIMARRMCWLVLAAVTLAPLIGCGGGTSQKPRTIKVVEQTGLQQARQLLERYAAGNPVGSEAESYGDIVSAVREEDAAKADILEAGLNQIRANPAMAPRKARELLSKL